MTPSKPCEHGVVVGRGDGHVARHLRGDLLDHLAGDGVDDLGGHLGRVAGARRWRRWRRPRPARSGSAPWLALAERHLDVVTGVPGGVGERLRAPRRAASARSCLLSTRPCASPGRSMPVMVPSPYAVASFWIGVSPYWPGSGPEHVAQVVEEGVARHRERTRDVVLAGRGRRGRRAACSRCRLLTPGAGQPGDLVAARVVVVRGRRPSGRPGAPRWP